MLLVEYNYLLVYGESAQYAYTSEQAITKAHTSSTIETEWTKSMLTLLTSLNIRTKW